MDHAQQDQSVRETVFGTAHAAGFFSCDPATLRNYAARGIVTPITSSTGRRMWRMEDLLVIAEYRRSRGLSDGGALLDGKRPRR